jgi:hypothetical protein
MDYFGDILTFSEIFFEFNLIYDKNSYCRMKIVNK